MSNYVVHNINVMVQQAVAALDSGGTARFPLIDGRIVAVLASPDDLTSVEMSMGISVLPAGYSTPMHNHRAEEFAMVISGTGSITIGGEVIAVGPGDVLVTPPDAPHVTTAHAGSRLVVYWSYGPAGSEQRWLEARGE